MATAVPMAISAQSVAWSSGEMRVVMIDLVESVALRPVASQREANIPNS